MSDFGRSLFTGIPLEYVIPKTARVIFVNDFFVKDIEGGAELTSEAIIQKSPFKVFKLHSGSVTKKLLDSNKDKYWIFGNFTTLPDGMIHYIPSSGIRYSIIEYDFKFCSFRSTNRHQQQTGQPCNCPQDAHGLDIGRMFQKADRVFWMSEGQKQAWLKNMPAMKDHSGLIVLSSVFQDKDLDRLKDLKEQAGERSPKWALWCTGNVLPARCRSGEGGTMSLMRVLLLVLAVGLMQLLISEIAGKNGGILASIKREIR
jgi:hypothetical protein